MKAVSGSGGGHVKTKSSTYFAKAFPSMVDASVMMFRDERDKGTNGVKTGRRNNKFMTIFSPLGCHGHDIQKKKNGGSFKGIKSQK